MSRLENDMAIKRPWKVTLKCSIRLHVYSRHQENDLHFWWHNSVVLGWWCITLIEGNDIMAVNNQWAHEKFPHNTLTLGLSANDKCHTKLNIPYDRKLLVLSGSKIYSPIDSVSNPIQLFKSLIHCTDGFLW